MKNAPVDKAVVLARGLGTRMRRAEGASALGDQEAAVADSGVKALIPIKRPFLDYVLFGLAEAGYRRVCLVIGPDHDATRDYYGRQLRTERLSIEFAVQVEPKGTADAVAAAEAFADGEVIAVLNSDNYYPVEALKALRQHNGSAVALFDWQSMLSGSNVSEERLSRFAVALVDEQGYLQRIIEKPDEATRGALPQPIWVSMNCWQFGPAIFEACRSIKPSPRGEWEITDAVQYARDVLGEQFRAVLVRAPVLDLSSRADIGPVKEKLAHVEVEL